MRPPTDSPPDPYEVLPRRRDALRTTQDETDPATVTAPGDPLVLPVPGRHISRRADREPRAVAGRAVAGAVVGVVPAPLRGRVGLGGAQLAVLGLVVAAALCLTAWWVLRADARTVEAPAPAAGFEPTADLVALEPPAADTSTQPVGGGAAGTEGIAGATGAGGPAGAAGAAAEGEVVVDVAGEVRRPGVVTLPVGARVVDALERAGGVRPGVDLSGLNLARILLDGEQVLVGSETAPDAAAGPPTPAASASAAPAAPGTPGAPVDLNTADVVALEALPEVGPVTAAAIVAWREENGGFTAVEELLEVDGIGDATHTE